MQSSPQSREWRFGKADELLDVAGRWLVVIDTDKPVAVEDTVRFDWNDNEWVGHVAGVEHYATIPPRPARPLGLTLYDDLAVVDKR